MTVAWVYQTIESFDGIGAHTFNQSPSLGGVRGPVPPGGTTGDARWTTDGYTVVTPGLYGEGQCIKLPQNATFTFENGAQHTSLRVRFAFAFASLTAGSQIICSLASRFIIEVTSGGKIQLRDNTGGGATWTSTGTTLAANTTYQAELCVYLHATAGAFGFLLNGSADTSLVLATTDGQSTFATGTPAAGSVIFNNTDATFEFKVDDVRVDATDDSLTGGFAAADFIGSSARIPKMSTCFASSQGNYSGFTHCGDFTAADNFCAISGSGDSTNYTYVDDASPDNKWGWLKEAGGARDSWIMTDLPAAAADIISVQTNLDTWSDSGFTLDYHFIRANSTNYDHADNGNFEYVGVGAQIGWSCRYWPTHPDTSAWVRADFPLEIGILANSGANITQALLIVEWFAALPVASGIYTLPMLGVGW